MLMLHVSPEHHVRERVQLLPGAREEHGLAFVCLTGSWYMYVCIYIYICIEREIYTGVCIYIYKPIYTHMYVYIYIYIHTYTCLAGSWSTGFLQITFSRRFLEVFE